MKLSYDEVYVSGATLRVDENYYSMHKFEFRKPGNPVPLCAGIVERLSSELLSVKVQDHEDVIRDSPNVSIRRVFSSILRLNFQFTGHFQ